MADSKKLILKNNASGAVEAAEQGFGIMVVDVIDMSTTLEAALDAGASMVFGASPDFTRAPVKVDPERMGKAAGLAARQKGAGIILIAEPRVGTDEERLLRCQKVMRGLNSTGAVIEAVIPNLGAETAKLVDFKDRIAVAVTDTGGVAFDAAYQITDLVVTGTIARTMVQKGVEPAWTAAARGLEIMEKSTSGLAVVAASANSQEDILAAQYIMDIIKSKM